MVDESVCTMLRDRFQTLWQRNNTLQAINAIPVYDDLARRYREPGRHYHGLTHVNHCLREFDRVAELIEIPDATELALWFHDAVYVPGAKDNEQRSADLFNEFGGTDLSPILIEKVSGLILVTTHKQPPVKDDESYVVDIDLSSFGEHWPDFVRDTLNVRMEQAHIPDTIYYANHAKFLKMLLDRPRIFHTDFFYQCYEESARQNIEQLLASIQYSGQIVDCN